MGGAIITVTAKTKEELASEIEKAIEEARRNNLLDVRDRSEPWYDEEEKIWKQAIWVHS